MNDVAFVEIIEYCVSKTQPVLDEKMLKAGNVKLKTLGGLRNGWSGS